MTNWIKNAPTPVLVAGVIMGGVVALAVLGAYVLLTINGADTTEFRQWVNTVGQIMVFPFLGITAAASAAAAKSANQAADQTNGHLADRDAEIIRLRAENTRLRGR